jgi:Cu(I)/Ag(I) efflux system membrane protein CusA/SilA
VLVAFVTIYPAVRLGGEFMPPLDEGDVLYMPSALPGISVGKVFELLQQTDRLIKTVPEVMRVFGKAGRAETATDPAPLEMLETTIQFKPPSEWRAGMTPDKLVEELDRVGEGARTLQHLGAADSQPHRHARDGHQKSVGVKVAGTNLQEIDRISGGIERVVRTVPGVTSALAERLTGGRYIDVKIDRDAASRYGMNIADVQSIVASAIGGDNVGETVEGLQRFPINVRYPREVRDSIEKLRNLSVPDRARCADTFIRRRCHHRHGWVTDATLGERPTVRMGFM